MNFDHMHRADAANEVRNAVETCFNQETNENFIDDIVRELETMGTVEADEFWATVGNLFVATFGELVE